MDGKHRLARALTLLVVVGCLVGCDAFYNITLENHMDEQVAVSVLDEQVVMRPCSVRRILATTRSYGRAFPVIVRDTEGREVYRTRLKAANATEAFSMTVTIPALGVEACPSPATMFTLHIWNHKSEAVELYHNGVLVGIVKARGDAQFGPFPGDWRGLPGLMIRDASGRERMADAFGGYPDYDLGQVPDIGIGVN